MAASGRPTDIAACGRCGSARVHPKLLVMGPIAGIDSDSRHFICEDCRYDGLPVMFDTEEAWAQFVREKRGIAAPASESRGEAITSIPIVPILTEPLVELSPLDLIPVQIASVVGVRWDGQGIRASAYRASFREYWETIGGPRYNASRVLMLDLTGIEKGNPNFEVLRHLVKRCDVWLDLGARSPEDLMDGYMLDVDRVVAGSKTLDRAEDFAELFTLSSEVLPCLDWDGQVIWRHPKTPRRGVREVAQAVRRMGFEEVCVMDLRRLGTQRGPDPELLAALQGLDVEVYLGGGLQETDVASLIDRGFAGAFVDPYTPVVRDLLRTLAKEAPAEAPAPTPKPPPAPSRRGIPDAG